MLIWKHLSLPVEAILNCHVVFFLMAFFIILILRVFPTVAFPMCINIQFLVLGREVCFEVRVPAPNSKFIILNVELGQSFYSSASSLTSESSTSISHVEKCWRCN